MKRFKSMIRLKYRFRFCKAVISRHVASHSQSAFWLALKPRHYHLAHRSAAQCLVLSSSISSLDSLALPSNTIQGRANRSSPFAGSIIKTLFLPLTDEPAILSIESQPGLNCNRHARISPPSVTTATEKWLLRNSDRRPLTDWSSLPTAPPAHKFESP